MYIHMSTARAHILHMTKYCVGVHLYDIEHILSWHCLFYQHYFVDVHMHMHMYIVYGVCTSVCTTVLCVCV